MKITTVEPERPKTKVIIEMTDDEAIALAAYRRPSAVSPSAFPAVHEFFRLIHNLTKEW